MTHDLRHVCREIARLRRGRPRTAVRYPVALRRTITTIARRRRGRGAGLTGLARDLGLPRWTLTLWLRSPAAAPVMRAVEVAPDPAPGALSADPGPVLVMPGGVRVEGASIAELTTLLRALR
jgi:hypothetical protein